MLSLILLQLCLLIASQVLHGQQQVLCVQASSGNSVSSSECKTLMDWYNNFSAAAFTSNTKLLFQEGIHSLHEFINISNCHNFTMAGNGSVWHDNNGLPQPTSIISCLGTFDAGLFISNSSNIRIQHLEFNICSGFYTLNGHYHFVGSLVLYRVQDVKLDQIVVNGTTGYGIHTVNIYGTNEISNSAFLNASASEHTIYRSGNADFFFDDFSNVITKLEVKSSWFMHGKNNVTAGGLSIEIHCTNVYVKLTNVTAKGNSGNYAGNIALSIALFSVNISSIIIENSHIVEGRANHGGGISILITKRKQPEYYTDSLCLSRHGTQQLILINKTYFHKNSASVTGGAMYIIYKDIDIEAGIKRKITIAKL